MKFYHGSETEIKEFKDGCIYVCNYIEHAISSALQFSETGYIYEVEIDESEFSYEENFKKIDIAGYHYPEKYPTNVVFNTEHGFAFVKDASVRNWKLIKVI